LIGSDPPNSTGEEIMRIRLLLVLAEFAIGIAVPAFAQEKEVPNPFRAIPASPQIAQQLEPINSQYDEAFNKHDVAAVAAFFTANATLVAPRETFSGRDGITKYFTDVFQRYNPSNLVTKLSYVYAFADDLCAIGGWTVTVHGRDQGGGFLIRVYTRMRDTWKIRLQVDKHQ
jgi:ketosteroid isomerase-like protein